VRAALQQQRVHPREAAAPLELLLQFFHLHAKSKCHLFSRKIENSYTSQQLCKVYKYI
jgi:hypothetical protein